MFANTGKERPETLDFVQRCSTEWNVPIVWVEYDWNEPHRTRRVSHNSASRNGEPFKALINRKGFVPNVGLRFCTGFLKRDRIDTVARHWKGWKRWHSVIGLRYDERHRVLRMRARDCGTTTGAHAVLPLDDARVTNADVRRFWNAQPFDLDLQPHEGNCDLCYLKGVKKLKYLMRVHPDWALWWIEAEHSVLNRVTPKGTSALSLKQFREEMPYKDLYALAHGQDDMFTEVGSDESVDCFCTD